MGGWVGGRVCACMGWWVISVVGWLAGGWMGRVGLG